MQKKTRTDKCMIKVRLKLAQKNEIDVPIAKKKLFKANAEF